MKARHPSSLKAGRGNNKLVKSKNWFLVLCLVLVVALAFWFSDHKSQVTPAPVATTTPSVVQPTTTVATPVVVKPTPKAPQESSTSTTKAVVVSPKPTALPSEDFTTSNVIILTNNDRIGNGLPPLQEVTSLDAAAQAKANDESARGYFSHTNPEGQAVWPLFQQNGYIFKYAGENLAVGWSDVSGQDDAFMASPTHRANVLGIHYTDVGVGIATGTWNGAPTHFVVVLFGSR